MKRGGGDFTPGGLEQIVMSDPWLTYPVSPMTKEFWPRAGDDDRQGANEGGECSF
jgi:hypothetical protein